MLNLIYRWIELQKNDTHKTAFKESNKIKVFYPCLSEIDFKEIINNKIIN